ncbi:MAG TPA: cupin domain-containing protein [Solirubrobacteraceae bacterium]
MVSGEPNRFVVRSKCGRAWHIGSQDEVDWINDGTSVGKAITAAIPAVFEAYATVDLPVNWEEAQADHDAAVVEVLRERSDQQPWWLGYLDTGADDVVFSDAPMVTVYQSWRYVLVQAGPEQALSWRHSDTGTFWKGALPNLMFPADRSWLASTLWDDDWMCIGGPAALIDSCLAHPVLRSRARRVETGDESHPRASPGGRVDTEEPFIVNLADAPASGHRRRATILDFETGRHPFADTGVNVQIMQPGQPNCRYHCEPVQEDFLVLHGECIAIIDGEERLLRHWDFLHCPAGTEHVLVGVGAGPCAVLMIGSRREEAAHYPVDAVAARYDASVAQATDDPGEAYADWRQQAPREPVPNPWPLVGRTADSLYWGAWIDNRSPSLPLYGIVVDPTPDADGNIEVMFDNGGLRRLDPEHGSLIDPAIVKADNPDVYERMLVYIGNYIGR